MKQIAIITGASKGIGAATALTLAKRGYEVCVNYNNSSHEAEKIVETIKANHGKAIAIQADMSIEADILRLFDHVDHALGNVTALVNNAGINGGINKVEDISLNCLQSVFATNVFGTFIASREAVKRMKKQRAGAIVNISSEAAKFGGTNISHYAASKAAINAFTIGFAREVAPYNIRVNTVSPGVIETEMHAASSEERIANLKKTLPMGRMGYPREVAELIAWLISDQSAYVSGAIIPITGSR